MEGSKKLKNFHKKQEIENNKTIDQVEKTANDQTNEKFPEYPTLRKLLASYNVPPKETSESITFDIASNNEGTQTSLAALEDETNAERCTYSERYGSFIPFEKGSGAQSVQCWERSPKLETVESEHTFFVGQKRSTGDSSKVFFAEKGKSPILVEDSSDGLEEALRNVDQLVQRVLSDEAKEFPGEHTKTDSQLLEPGPQAQQNESPKKPFLNFFRFLKRNKESTSPHVNNDSKEDHIEGSKIRRRGKRKNKNDETENFENRNDGSVENDTTKCIWKNVINNKGDSDMDGNTDPKKEATLYPDHENEAEKTTLVKRTWRRVKDKISTDEKSFFQRSEDALRRKWSEGLINLNIRRSLVEMLARSDKKEKEKTLEEYEMDAFWDEIRSKFLLSRKWKYVAWILAVTLAVANIITLVMANLLSGKVTKWWGCLLMAFIAQYFVVQPIKILIQASLLRYVFELDFALNRHAIPPEVLRNPHDGYQMAHAQKYRMDNAEKYTIMQPRYARVRKAQLIKLSQVRSVFTDLTRLFLFALLLFCFVYGDQNSMAYFSTRTVHNLVVAGHYTNSMSLMNVCSKEKFMKYIESTLVPALMVNSTESLPLLTSYRAQKAPPAKKPTGGTASGKKPPTSTKPSGPGKKPTGSGSGTPAKKPPGSSSPPTTKKTPAAATTSTPANPTTPKPTESPSDGSLIPPILTWEPFDGNPVTRMLERARTFDGNFKLVGNIRLRQHRVTKQSCTVSRHVKSKNCFAELNWLNMDTGSYSEGWQPILPGDAQTVNVSLNSNTMPWMWRSAESTQTGLTIGRMNPMTAYGGGGFTIFLGKSQKNAFVTMDFISYYNWIDPRTRVIFVEFTLYSQNADLYNIVTLIVEVSATGIFVPSYEINTARLLMYNWELGFHICAIVALAIVVGSKVWTIYYRIQLIGSSNYFTEAGTLLDLLMVVFSTGVVLASLAALLTISEIKHLLNTMANNEYVSFHNIPLISGFRNTSAGFTVVLTVLQIFRISTCMVTFHRWEQVLRVSWRPVLAILACFIYLSLVISFFFYLDYGKYEESFGVLWSGFAHTIKTASGFNMENSILASPQINFELIICLIFISCSAFVMIHMFAIMLRVHLHEVNTHPLRSAISIEDYMLSLLESNHEAIPMDFSSKRAITLVNRRYKEELPFIDKMRLDGMCKGVVNILSGKSFNQDQKIIGELLRCADSGAAGTDTYNIVPLKDEKVILPERIINSMKALAKLTLQELNDKYSD